MNLEESKRPTPRRGSTVAGSSARKTEADPLERYYTPFPIALALCRRWRHRITGRVCLDPFAGSGVWLRAAHEVGARMTIGCDIDPHAPSVLNDQAVLADGLEAIATTTGGMVLVTNPPFSLVNETIRAIVAGLAEGRLSAAILLGRLTLQEGQARRGLWRTCPPEAEVVPAARIAWEGPGGDLMVGTDNYGAIAVLWGERTAWGDTRIAQGWDPSDEGVGAAAMDLFGRAR